jgi:hypothetical protein
MKKHLEMNELESIGFELVRSYTNWKFIVQIRKKGCIEACTTWSKNGEFASQEFNITTKHKRDFKIEEISMLDKILNN